MADQSASADTRLTVPEPVRAVTRDEAFGRVPVPDDAREELDEQAERFTSELLALPNGSPEYKLRVRRLEELGVDGMARVAALSNRFTERPTHALKGLGEAAPVAKTLLELRAIVEKLDPSRHGDLSGARKLFGLIPIGTKLRDYFRGYESSQSSLNAIVAALRRGKDELLRDNAAIEVEKATMWALMGQLERDGYLARAVANRVEEAVQGLRHTNPQHAKILQEDVLFAARQKEQDIATQLAVAVQGYLAQDLVKRNNNELVKGVDRATTTTVAALRTAVITAQALANQKLVMQQIDSLRTTTSNLISATSAMLKSNAAEIQQSATAPIVDIDTLKEAFSNVRATIDGMADYRLKALSSMESTVNALNIEVGNAKAYLATRANVSALP